MLCILDIAFPKTLVFLMVNGCDGFFSKVHGYDDHVMYFRYSYIHNQGFLNGTWL